MTVPHEIVYRTNKGSVHLSGNGCPTVKPADYSMRLRRSILFSAPIFDMDDVRGIAERSRRGREDMTLRLWYLINLQLWGDIFIRGKKDNVVVSAIRSASVS